MRYGFNNEQIEVYKFRSMYVEHADAEASKLVTKDNRSWNSFARVYHNEDGRARGTFRDPNVLEAGGPMVNYYLASAIFHGVSSRLPLSS